MRKNRYLIFAIISLLIICQGLEAQNNNYSPYSRFGIGDIARSGFSRNQAMGGIGFGLRDPNHINILNPAANSAQDTMSFIFSTGIAGNTMQLTSNQGSHNVSNITLSHLAISFPVMRWWKTGFGLIPYSQMGYKLVDIDLDQGAEHYYDGSGGINQFYFGNSLNLTKNLSAGLNVSYLFGSLSQTRRLLFPETANRFSVTSNSRAVVGDFHIRYGMQYHNNITENYNYTVGIIYENKTPLTTSQELLTYNELNTPAGIVRDTVPNKYFAETSIDLPSNLGIAFTIRRTNKLIVGADYSVQRWSETTFLNQQNDSLVNSSSFNIGAQYIPDYADFRSYLRRINYRLGFHYSNTYLQIRGHQIKDYGVTIGFGLPHGNTRSSFNFAVDIGQRGTTDLNLIRENYVMFNFSLSLYDFWFFKRRFE